MQIKKKRRKLEHVGAKDEDVKLEVCRICEKKIKIEKLQRHTEICLKIKDFTKQCDELNNLISEQLQEIHLESIKDKNSRRETRRMTYIPNYGDELLFEDYINKVQFISSCFSFHFFPPTTFKNIKPIYIKSQ